MNILITGAAGFIGSSLADRLLAKGHGIINVDNFNDYYDVKIKWRNISEHINNPNYKLYCLNLENKAELSKVFKNEKIDMVIHLAGRAGVRPSIQDPESYIKTNILGTVHILELMKDFGVKKLVFASSSSVYGNCDAEMFSEDLKVVEPISQYAATKSSDEQFVYTYTKLYGMQAICLRFFTVYGPRQRPDLAISKFTRLILNDEPVPMYGDGTTKRDYTYIDDIVSGIMGAIAYDKTPYEIVNLGGGEPITLTRMIETIEAELGKKAVVIKLPMQAGDVNKTVCDYSKARSLFGYCPHTTFKEGIHLFCDWYRKQ